MQHHFNTHRFVHSAAHPRERRYPFLTAFDNLIHWGLCLCVFALSLVALATLVSFVLPDLSAHVWFAVSRI